MTHPPLQSQDEKRPVPQPHLDTRLVNGPVLMKGAQAEDRYTEEDRPTRGRQTYSENGLHGDEDRAELRDRVRPMQDKSHEVPLRRIPLTRMRGLRA